VGIRLLLLKTKDFQNILNSMKKNVALVLSGGGARGIAHIGVIEELLSRGYNISSIAGTSMGSLIGGVYALGKMDVLKEWAYTLDKKKAFSLVDFTMGKQGMVRGDKVFNKMKELIPDANIEDLRIPYAAVAVDIISRKEVVFKRGSLYDAIRASVAIPTVLTPVKSEHGLLVDGGLLNNIPIDHVQRKKRDKLIAVNVNANIPAPPQIIHETDHEEKESRYKRKTKEFYKHLQKMTIGDDHEEENLGYFNLISRTIEIMTWRIDEFLLECHKPDHLIEISREASAIWDFYKAEELVEQGRRAAIKALDKN